MRGQKEAIINRLDKPLSSQMLNCFRHWMDILNYQTVSSMLMNLLTKGTETCWKLAKRSEVGFKVGNTNILWPQKRAVAFVMSANLHFYAGIPEESRIRADMCISTHRQSSWPRFSPPPCCKLINILIQSKVYGLVDPIDTFYEAIDTFGISKKKISTVRLLSCCNSQDVPDGLIVLCSPLHCTMIPDIAYCLSTLLDIGASCTTLFYLV